MLYNIVAQHSLRAVFLNIALFFCSIKIVLTFAVP